MNKRQRIVDAARKRFRHYGISKTTMQEIAADAGVAVGTLYLYFGNKDDLIVACAEEYVRRHRERAAAILNSAAPADRMLRSYVVDRFRQAELTRTSSRHAAEITRAVLRVKPDRVREEGQMIYDNVLSILRRGVAEGRFAIDDPQGDAQVFLLSIACFFPSALAEPSMVPKRADLLRVIDWFLGVWKSAAKRGKRARTRARRSA